MKKNSPEEHQTLIHSEFPNQVFGKIRSSSLRNFLWNVCPNLCQNFALFEWSKIPKFPEKDQEIVLKLKPPKNNIFSLTDFSMTYLFKIRLNLMFSLTGIHFNEIKNHSSEISNKITDKARSFFFLDRLLDCVCF